MSRLGQVREYFQQHKDAFVYKVAEDLKLDRDQAYRDVRELVKSGYLEKLEEPGLYGWRGEPPRNRPILETIWKAMRIAREFSARSLEVITGASHDYIRRYITHLKRTGYIRAIGQGTWPGQYAKVTIYHVLPQYRHKQEAPAYSRRAQGATPCR